MIIRYFILLGFLFCQNQIFASDILAKLKAALPNAQFQTLDNGRHFVEEYIIHLEQPLDHNDPSAGTFTQRMFLAHYNFNEPMLMVTEGYSAYPQYYELCEMLMSNQLIIEYRFYGESKPENYDYRYLTNDQAAADYHRIKKLLGKLYKKDWISTGISKGGTTCLIHKTKYPKDVKAVVAYVAPLPKAREDKRCDEFILSQGSSSCQKALKNFQLHALSQKDEILPMLDSLAKNDSLSYNYVSIKEAFEYAVLEFTFSFWQYGHDCDAIPRAPDPEDSFQYLNEIVGFDFYCDESIDYFHPSFYQFMTENGYYGFIHDYLVSKIEYVSDFTNVPFAPQNVNLEYKPDYLKRVRVDLYHHGDGVIYIYGALDPWTACKMSPSKKSDALIIIDADGDHKTRISSLSPSEIKQVTKKLGEWLKRDIKSS